MLTSLALLAVEPLLYMIYPIYLIRLIIFLCSILNGTGKWASIVLHIGIFLFIVIIVALIMVIL